VKAEPRRHTYVFVGFTAEEEGLVGSDHYARHMTRDEVAATDAMINLDSLGLAPTEVWNHRADPQLVYALMFVSRELRMPLAGVNFERAGYSTDSESFAARKIRRITIHSLTQRSEDRGILHSVRDNLSAMNLDEYYDTYHLLAAYLAAIDTYFDRAADAAPDRKAQASP